MAKIVITLTDLPDGNVHIQLLSTPKMSGDSEKWTIAQVCSYGAVMFVKELLEKNAGATTVIMAENV